LLEGQAMSKILIIEDSLNFAQTISLWLERKGGHQCLLANTGSTGIEQYNQHSPDLVLLDYQLPDMTGAEVCDRIRRVKLEQHQVPPPVLMMSGNYSDRVRAECLSKGASGFLHKPFEPQLLLAQVKALIENAVLARLDVFELEIP